MTFKKLISVFICIVMLVSTVAFAAPGDIAGDIYYTDIITYIYHSPITSYNIGGKTVIDAEILNWHYGFDVYWFADTRRLEITDKGEEFESNAAKNGELVESVDGIPGNIYTPYYETDIVTTLNGKPIESYNLNGRTVIVAEAMRDFGYDVAWDADARTLTVKKPNNFFKIKTDYGTIKTTKDLSRKTAYTDINHNPILYNSFETKFELPLNPNRTLTGPGGYDRFVKLSAAAAAFNAECTLVEEKDGDSYTYYIDFKYNPENKPKLTAYKDSPNAGKTFTPIDDVVFDVNLGFVVNGKSTPLVTMYGGKEFEYSAWVVDNELYIPIFTLAKMLGYKYCV